MPRHEKDIESRHTGKHSQHHRDSLDHKIKKNSCLAWLKDILVCFCCFMTCIPYCKRYRRAHVKARLQLIGQRIQRAQGDRASVPIMSLSELSLLLSHQGSAIARLPAAPVSFQGQIGPGLDADASSHLLAEKVWTGDERCAATADLIAGLLPGAQCGTEVPHILIEDETPTHRSQYKLLLCLSQLTLEVRSYVRGTPDQPRFVGPGGASDGINEHYHHDDDAHADIVPKMARHSGHTYNLTFALNTSLMLPDDIDYRGENIRVHRIDVLLHDDGLDSAGPCIYVGPHAYLSEETLQKMETTKEIQCAIVVRYERGPLLFTVTPTLKLNGIIVRTGRYQLSK